MPRAALGTLTIMIGGDDPAAIERARPLLSTMGERLFDTGGLGSGHAMKALNNFVAAATFAACAEALLAGQRFGLDPKRMVEILNVSTGAISTPTWYCRSTWSAASLPAASSSDSWPRT